jgi:serine/threonine-protein kinase
VSSAREARNAFGATHALSGTVHWGGDRIAISTNLVDTRTQTVTEARDFEVPADDIAGAGRLLVQKVAEMLELERAAELQGGSGDAFATSSAASTFYLQGRGYLQRYDRLENVERSLEAFDRALKKDPTFALAYAGKAEAWLRHDRIVRDPSSVEQARANARRAVELGGNLAQVEVTAGMVQLAAGEPGTAIETFNRALRIEPANAYALRELGNAYDAAGKIADAEATFQRAVELRPESWAAVRDLGAFYNNHGRLQDALTAFQRVVAVTPDNYASYGNIGGLYIRMGRYEDAAAALKKSLALRPTVQGFMNLGTVHYFSGRFAEASDAYRKATQLAPSDERAWGALADALRWVAGNADEVAGAYREAIALAEQQRTLNPNNAELRSRVALYHAYVGDRRAADVELKEALRLDPRDATVLFRAALVEEQLGRRALALQWIEQSLKSGGTREEISKAPALAALRQDPRYASIMSR